ncbi:MAG: hypothetical protein WC391_09940 [Methanoregula sp.]
MMMTTRVNCGIKINKVRLAPLAILVENLYSDEVEARLFRIPPLSAGAGNPENQAQIRLGLPGF